MVAYRSFAARLTVPAAVQPDFSGFHPVFRDLGGDEDTPEGDVRRGFYLSYDDTNCEYLTARRSTRSWTPALTWSRQRS
jgi:hypothetical protein